jgi:tRNA nucleotidyltransferase (CCA-adding enzyme)
MNSEEKCDASVSTLVLKDGEEKPCESHHRVTIYLSPQEELLISTIQSALKYLEKGEIPNYTPQSVEVRIAGGWVRDKLLGLSTYDVDLAIDVLSGLDFATVLQSYLKLRYPEEVHKVGVIAANPNQSKHLETATMIVMGIECDFCNLRAQEVYTEDSRIPVTRFGTPLEDAQRRDFCLNALFFNLKTNLVEDWTGRGLTDLLERRILVTPLDPFTTFHDDPLRVLRGIRFAIRFGYDLDPKIREASSSKIIHLALGAKVSRERIGKELEGMLSGKGAKAHSAMSLIGELNLSDCVFCLPNDVKIQGKLLNQPFSFDNMSEGWIVARSFMDHVATAQATHIVYSQARSVLDRRLFALAAYLLPFRHLYYIDGKSKHFSVVNFMMRESIKFKNKDVAEMATMMENVDSFVSLLTKFELERLEIGLLLRSTKELWVTCLFLAAVISQSFEQAQSLYSSIVDMNLDNSWKARPLLDGRELIQALELPKGPLIGVYLDEQVKWMLQHTEGTKDECKEHLLAFKKQIDTKRRSDQTSNNEESKRIHIEN